MDGEFNRIGWSILGLLVCFVSGVGCGDSSSGNSPEANTPMTISDAPPCDNVFSGDFELLTNEDVEKLDAYCKVEGNLRMEESSITDLELPNLIEVTGDIHIIINYKLTHFSLPKLHTVGRDFRIGQGYPYGTNQKMTGFSAPALTRVKRDLRIMDNIVLESFEFPSLMEVGGILWVGDNRVISRFSFPNLFVLGKHILVENNAALLELELNRIEEVGGNLWTGDNPSLTTMTIPNLAEIGEILWINNNKSLRWVPFSGIKKVRDSVQIAYNTSLPQCLVDGMVEQITSDSGEGPEVITSNNNTNCTCVTGTAGLESSCLCDDVICESDGDSCTQDLCSEVNQKGVCYGPYPPNEPAAAQCSYYDGEEDGIPAEADNCPSAFNPEQWDWNGNGTGDACNAEACLGVSDLNLLDGQIVESMKEPLASCMDNCSEGEGKNCNVAECLAEATGLTADCSGCVASLHACETGKCGQVCNTAQGQWAPDCAQCLNTHCRDSFGTCSGIGIKTTGNCPAPQQRFCDYRCYPGNWWEYFRENGTCETPLACEEFGFDNGDCTPLQPGVAACPKGEIGDCSGTCTPVTQILNTMGDGSCDSTLDCTPFDSDGGDCGLETCPGNSVPDCLNGCSPLEDLVSTYTSGLCRHTAACSMWDYDGGDCVGQCSQNQEDLLSLLALTIFVIGEAANDCLLSCQNAEEQGQCVNQCFGEALSLSPPCALCFSILGQCMYLECGTECINQPAAPECLACGEEKCMAILTDCAGPQLTSE